MMGTTRRYETAMNIPTVEQRISKMPRSVARRKRLGFNITALDSAAQAAAENTLARGIVNAPPVNIIRQHLGR